MIDADQTIKVHDSRKLAEINLSRLEAEYAQASDLLHRLREYKEEYSSQVKERMAGNVSADEIQDYRYFFASLYKAISQQESVVNHLQKKINDLKLVIHCEPQP